MACGYLITLLIRLNITIHSIWGLALSLVKFISVEAGPSLVVPNWYPCSKSLAVQVWSSLLAPVSLAECLTARSECSK